MGLFDPAKDNAYRHISTDEVCYPCVMGASHLVVQVGSAASQAKSLLAAHKSMVLLKKGPLPFSKGHTAS